MIADTEAPVRAKTSITGSSEPDKTVGLGTPHPGVNQLCSTHRLRGHRYHESVYRLPLGGLQ